MTQAVNKWPEFPLDKRQDKRAIERRLAILALGLLEGLRTSVLSLDQARDELFNLDTYTWARCAKLSGKLVELLERAMELENVAKLNAAAWMESLDEMEKLARQIVTHAFPKSLRAVGAARARVRTPRARSSKI